jgi:D-glycero-alpha-D-manno-heptose 1-phosphate guanylyltransferase
MPLRPAIDQYAEDIKAVLLVGGLGTRLRSVVPSAPKPLASVGNRSFLELLVRQLQYQGIRRLVMCTGHLGDQIENEFGDGKSWDVAIEYSREPHPLGTAGAVKLAESYLREVPEFLVMNGDSFLEIDFRDLVRFHRRHAGLVSMAVLQVENAARYGTVRMDAENRVTGFSEKTGGEACGLVNAGVYVFERTVLDYIPEGPTSLERDIFPRLLNFGVHAQEQRGMFIDIGTPEDYARAQQLRDRLYETAFRKQDCPVPEAG